MRTLIGLLICIPVIASAQISYPPGVSAAQAVAAAPVQSVSGRTGAVVLGVSDVSGAAPLASPVFTGTPTVPGYLTSTSAGTTYAPIASPTFTGTATAPNVSVTSALTTVNLTHSGPEMDTTVMSFSPATGGSVSLIPGTNLITPSGSLLTLSISLPACSSTVNGEIVRMASTQTITTVTLSAVAGAIASALSTLLQGGGAGYICRGSNTTWYRLY